MKPNIEKVLFLEAAIKSIREINKPFKATIENNRSLLNGLKATIKPDRKEFVLTFNYDIFSPQRKKIDVGEVHKRLTLSSKNKKIVLSSLFLFNRSTSEIKGSVSSFYSKGYSKKKKYYYRLLIPLSKRIDFHYCVENILFQTETTRSSTATKVIVNDIEIFAFVYFDKLSKKYYLIFEVDVKQDYQEFSEKAFALKNSLGFLTGHLPGDKAYFLAYTKKTMVKPTHIFYNSIRDSIVSGYTPIYTNPYGYLSKQPKLAEKYYKSNLLKPLSIINLSNFAQKLHDDIEFTSAVVLILESSVASLLFMPGGYAIALESLSDIILGKDKLKKMPIKDKAKSRIIKVELFKVIEKYHSEIGVDGFDILSKRIDSINQIPNSERLKAPFDKLRIQLIYEDLEILKTRNDFLHGRVPDITKQGKLRTLDRINRDLYYASMRFYTLLSLLILKYIGFDNYVLNHPKIHESYCKIKLKEQPYRKV